jgi:hypothetical protein
VVFGKIAVSKPQGDWLKDAVKRDDLRNTSDVRKGLLGFIEFVLRELSVLELGYSEDESSR